MNSFDYNILIAFIIALLSGCAPIIYKHVTHKANIPIHMVLLVTSVTYLVSTLLYICIFHRKTFASDVSKVKDYIGLLAVTAFFAFFLVYVAYLYILHTSKNINIVVVITALYPVVTLLVSWALFKEALSIGQLIGFTLIILGISIMLGMEKTKQN
jgi:drug/metabolite transporter (DMT)-like permease